MATTREQIVVELDASIAAFEAKLSEAGRLTQSQAKRINSAMKSVQDSAKQGTKGFNNFNQVVQQAGFQVGDFAVQVEQGTSPLRAFTQQGSQLAGVFGPGGAVVGAIIAVGGALVGALLPGLFESDEQAKELVETLKELSEVSSITAEQAAVLSKAEQDTIKTRKESLAVLKDEQAEIENQIRNQNIALSIRDEEDKVFKRLTEAQTKSNEKLNENIAQQQLLNAEIEKSNQKIELYASLVGGEGSEALEKASEEAANFTKLVTEQANALGKSTSELLREKAALMDLNAEQQQAVDNAIKLIEAKEMEAEATRKLNEARREGAELASEFEQYAKEEEQLRAFVMTREEILNEQLINDLARLEEAQELLGLSEDQFYAKRLELLKDFINKKRALEDKENRQEKKLNAEAIKDAELREKAKTTATEKGIKAGMVLANAFFEDNKAIAAGLIVADTAAAIVKSLSINPYDYANVALIAATGAANLAAALGATKGGGGGPSAPSGGSPANNASQEFFPESTSLEVSNIEEGASGTFTVEFDPTGDDILDAIMEGIKIRSRQET